MGVGALLGVRVIPHKDMRVGVVRRGRVGVVQVLGKTTAIL